jgi:hypothetical protein
MAAVASDGCRSAGRRHKPLKTCRYFSGRLSGRWPRSHRSLYLLNFHFGQRRNNLICSFQAIGVFLVLQAHAIEAAIFRCQYAGLRILDHDALFDCKAKTLGRSQEDFRIGFSIFNVVSANDNRKRVKQSPTSNGLPCNNAVFRL